MNVSIGYSGRAMNDPFRSNHSIPSWMVRGRHHFDHILQDNMNSQQQLQQQVSSYALPHNIDLPPPPQPTTSIPMYIAPQPLYPPYLTERFNLHYAPMNPYMQYPLEYQRQLDAMHGEFIMQQRQVCITPEFIASFATAQLIPSTLVSPDTFGSRSAPQIHVTSLADLPKEVLDLDQSSQNNECELGNGNPNVWLCEWGKCMESFSTKTGRATHCASHFNHVYDLQSRKPTPDFICQWRGCHRAQQPFVTFVELATHISEEHMDRILFMPDEGFEEVKAACAPPTKRAAKSSSSESDKKPKKEYFCKFPGCGRAFNDCSNRRKHEKTHMANRERYHCTYSGCNKSYSTKTDLNMHMKGHRGEFPHKCSHPQCNKAFVRMSELYAHERIHDNIFPHECNLCGKKFREKAKLKRHFTECSKLDKDVKQEF